MNISLINIDNLRKEKSSFLLFIGAVLAISTLVIYDIPPINASLPATNTSAVNNNIALVDSEGIVPFGVETEPPIVRVGDRFNIDAYIFNYSPLTVRIPDGGCSPTGLSATFDGNVAVEPGAQFLQCYQDTLSPAETLATSAGWPLENYTATSPGLTNATLHLTYNVIGDNNQTEMRQSNQEFQFTIIPKFP